jgi:hypothetical protein
LAHYIRRENLARGGVDNMPNFLFRLRGNLPGGSVPDVAFRPDIPSIGGQLFFVYL